jgi:ABC-type glycerol-3-phosphate transport system permease component
MIINSLKTTPDISKYPFDFPGTAKAALYVGAYSQAWTLVSQFIVNTVLVAGLEIVGVVFLSSMAAYGFTRFKFKEKELLFTVFLAFMMVPGILTLASQYALVYSGLNLKQTIAGVVLPAIAGGMPVNIFLIKTFFAGVPDSLFEAAEIDGASHMRRYFTFALPLSLPILFTIGLSTLMGAWNDVIWAGLILQGKEELYTISLGVFERIDSGNKSLMYAAYTIASLPLIIAFALTSKQFIKGLTNGAIKM